MFSNFISMSFPDISSNEIKKNIDIDNFKLPITYLNNNELYPIPNNVSDDLDPNFKATVMKKYEGFEKTLAGIRINLQKITETNYEKLKPELMEMITQIITTDNKDEINRMCDTLIN